MAKIALVILLALAALAALAAAAAWIGAARWRARGERLLAALEAARTPVTPERFDPAELSGLPAPVARYFRAALTEGQPMIGAVRLEHSGTFNMSETAERWAPFTSTQRVSVRRPGFVWDAKMRLLPGLPARVHDAYVAGEGILHGTLLGLITLVEMRGTPEVAEGELMRFFAEAAWYPTALLPSQGVRWEAVDDTSARATLADGPLALTLLFRFDETGLIRSVRAQARGRASGGRVIPTPWEGRWSDYAARDGMRVPLRGEVAWVLPDGPRPYWRGRVTDLAYEFAR